MLFVKFPVLEVHLREDSHRSSSSLIGSSLERICQQAQSTGGSLDSANQDGDDVAHIDTPTGASQELKQQGRQPQEGLVGRGEDGRRRAKVHQAQ